MSGTAATQPSGSSDPPQTTSFDNVQIKTEQTDFEGDLSMPDMNSAPAAAAMNDSQQNRSTEPDPNAAGASAADAGAGEARAEPGPPGIELPLPPKKDKSLREFLSSMDEYAPIIPDAVTDYYLAVAGLDTNDVRLKRLLALATQKFISDIATDAYQYSRMRSNNPSNTGGGFPAAAGGIPGAGMAGAGIPGVGGAGGGGGGALRPMPRPGYGGGGGSGTASGRSVLTMEDLGAAVSEYGVNTKRPEFYR